MRELTTRLLAEGRDRASEAGAAAEAEATVGLLYARLSPVIGSGGMKALIRRVSRSLEGRYGDMSALLEAEGEEDARRALRQVLGNGADQPEALVRDLIDEMVGMLERMIGSELTARLVARSETKAGGGSP